MTCIVLPTLRRSTRRAAADDAGNAQKRTRTSKTDAEPTHTDTEVHAAVCAAVECDLAATSHAIYIYIYIVFCNA